MKTLALALTTALAATALAPAHASRAATFEVEVTYTADELATVDGAETVLSKIVKAAEKECFRDTFGLRLRTSVVTEKCVAPAVGDAVARIDNANLTSAYDAAFADS